MPPNVPPDIERKRHELKKELYYLLLEHKNGILKINVWTLLKQRSKFKLNNGEFRVGSMDALFNLFSDMVHQEHRDGQVYICINPSFEPQSLLHMPAATSGSVRPTQSPAHQGQSTIYTAVPLQQSPKMASDAFLSQQISRATRGLTPPGYRMANQLPSLMTMPVQRWSQPTQLRNPIPSNPVGRPIQRQPARESYQDKSRGVLSSSSDEDDSDIEEGVIGISENRVATSLMKIRLIDILRDIGPCRLGWLSKKYKSKYGTDFKSHAGFSIFKITEVFSDAIDRGKIGGGKTEYFVKEGFLNSTFKKREATVKQEPGTAAIGIGAGKESVIDLTEDTPALVDMSSDFISLETPGTSKSSAPMYRNTPGQGRKEVVPQRLQYSAKDLLPNEPAPYETSHANTKPLSKKRFEEKELNVAPIRRMNRATRPTKEQLENAAQECIEIIAESDSYVSSERIEKLLVQRFQVGHMSHLGVRYVDQIEAVNQHNRMLSKVNAYVHAYVKVRTICTLHELRECLKEFTPGRTHFSKLNLGPLQRMPVIYQLFKFPTDLEEIPEITTMDVLEHLRGYLTEKQKWTAKVDLEDFMEYLVDKYDADNAFQLGVRIRSLVLAVQVLKKAQRDIGSTRRSLTEGFKEQLKKDIESVFQKFKMTIMHTASDGQWEVRNHYSKLSPEMAISEIFQKFNLIMSLDEPEGAKQKKQHVKLKTSITSFLDSVRDNVIARTLFHLAVCVSNTLLEESAMEILAPQQKEAEIDLTKEERVRPSKGTVIALVEKYLKRVLQHGTLNLNLLDKIEEKITDETNYPSFHELGYGRFLHFILQEARGLLEECGGTSIGSGSGSGDVESGYKPNQTDILSFIHQCLQCGKESEEDIESALCNQFNVKEAKHLGFGKTASLIATAQKPGQHQYQEHSMVFEVAMGTEIRKTHDLRIGMLGHQTKETAFACLHNCPLLEDLAVWSHWSLVFEPELGKLKDFIQKYGGTNSISIDGGRKLFTYHIAAMETKPGVLLKLTSMTSTELFEEALTQRNSRNVCGQLLSLIVANKGITNTPMALLANQMKSHLFTMHATDTADSLPGAPPTDSISDAVKFVLQCLVTLPMKSCVTLANQIFLEPLGQVVGSSKSKFLLLSACETPEETNKLQELGCMLGVVEWTNQILKKCQIMIVDTEIIPEEEGELIVLDDMEDREEDIMQDEESDDSTSVTSSHCSILSDDDDIQIVSVEKGPEVKKEVKVETGVVELSTGDEESQNEIDLDESAGDMKVVDEIKEEAMEQEEDVTKETEKQDGEGSGNDSDIEILTEEEKQFKECEKVINNIRREDFGIGIELNEDGQRLKKVQDERMGRSLDRLSKDLYSKDTHFVLELIQNADDNEYPPFLARNGEIASVKFMMQPDGVIVLNNESGFQEKNIRALCDVGRSTKGKHKFGYIGQKGIGFKSVFRVTDKPEVHSNGYHICFDVQSGPMGYILPHWIEDQWETEPGWTTKIILPLKDEMKVHTRSLAARFNDIHPSLLLFLHRLRRITIDNKVENTTMTMTRYDLGEGVIEIEHNDGIDRWLVVKKMLDASKISLQAKSGVEVESTEIAIAFPLLGQALLNKVLPPKQPVFAFLPLRSYGFRFIIQADFDVPSSREDVDRDSAWNQWIRNEIHKLFLEALDVFKNHREFTGMKALINFLQFVPMEDEILDFFRPVSTQILKQLRAKPCLPTQPNNRGVISWKLPTQVVTVKDALVREVVSPDFLQKHLDLFYLHREVSDLLNPTLIQCLGIESLTTKHLLLIGQAIVSLGKQEIAPEARLMLLAKWLACVYRSLDEFHDNQETYTALKKMKIIPLASREYVSLEDNTVFFPLSAEQSKPNPRDPLYILQEDMNTIHPWFLATNDNEVNSQNQKMLLKLSVRTLTPQDVINHHIFPILKSELWKTKKRETLISYLIFIKENVERDSSLVNMDELANVAIVMTNQGEKNPKKDNIHFTPLYGNKYDLMQKFPGYNWCLLDGVYIQNLSNSLDKQRWHRFFSKLGVTDFITVRPTSIELNSETVKDSAWEALAQLHPDDFKEGCVIEDYSCDELRDLLKENKTPQTYEAQMKSLVGILDQVWDSDFSRFTRTKLTRKDNKQEREVDSSFSIWLKTLEWLPAIKASVSFEKNNIVKYREEFIHKQPSTLYYPFAEIVQLLFYTVTYCDVEFCVASSSFAKFLGLKFEVSIDDLLKSFKTWGERSDPNIPSHFVTSHDHIQKIYNYLSENLSRKQIQDFLDKDPVMFVPVKIQGFDYGTQGAATRYAIDVAGQMLTRKEVWWEEKTELFLKYQETLDEVHADIASKKILSEYSRYAQSKELREFFKIGFVQECPIVEEYAELLVHVAGSQSRVEPRVLDDVMKIYSRIGELMYVDENDPEKETKKMMYDIQKKRLLNIFKGQGVIPTKRKTWVSPEKKPVIADQPEFEHIFSDNEMVHFVLFEEFIHKRRFNMDKYKASSTYYMDPDARMSVLKMCGIENLSDIVDQETIFDMFIPCPKLQAYMVQCAPILQKFLFYNYRAVYQSLIEGEMVKTLSELKCIETNNLEVRYWFRTNEAIYAIRKESCSLKNDQFIFHKESLESYGEINKVIARVFSNNDNHCMRELRNFLTDIQSCLTGQSPERILTCMLRYGADELPETEEIWKVPEPILPEPEPEPEPEVPAELEEGEIQDTVGGTGEGQPQEPGVMKAWPPMSDAVKKNHPKSKTKREDNPESKVWPPPRAPDYMKSVKDLPSGVRVIHDGPREAHQGEYNAEMREEGGDKSQYYKDGHPPGSQDHIPLLGDDGQVPHRQGLLPHPGQDKRGLLPHPDQEKRGLLPHPDQEKRGLLPHPGQGQSGLLPHPEGQDGSQNQDGSQQQDNEPMQQGGEQEVLQPGEIINRLIELGTNVQSSDPSTPQQQGGPTLDETNLSGKRRRVSGGDSNSHPMAKRPAIIGLPVWEKELGEYEEEELAKGDKLVLPQSLLSDQSNKGPGNASEIGRLGESIVQQYLQKELDENPSVSYVTWCNEAEEQGQPYDFEVGVVTEDEEFTVYIEVKSTLSDSKEIFEISYPQIKFAQENKNRFHVYRVFNASNPDQVRLVRIQNLAEKINEKHVKLCLVI